MEPDCVQIWTTAQYHAPWTLKEYQLQSREFLTGVQQLHNGFGRLAAVGQAGSMVAGIQDSSVEQLIESLVFDPKHLEDYLYLLPTGRLGPNSLSRIGFSVSYGLLDSTAESILPLESGGVRLRLQGSSASQEPEANIRLEMCHEQNWQFSTRQYKTLLRYCIDKWKGHVGGVSSRSFELAVRGTDRASYAGQWLFYLPFPGLAKCLPPDIRHEPFANGILIETTPHLPDANNPADVAAGKRVRDVLDEFGLINDATYAIEGWPPDPDEARYEQFISGAPAGRKYTVHCINFDGYDPDRKVLLYAKLFRRLRRHPKEWGLRGWDGPVLNEAKRQVRAAAKAGGVQIEWHIGLEEPAHAVRQLLADHTNITDQQLRVIHTPLEQARNPPHT